MSNNIQCSDLPLFSIIIPSWNNLPFLKICVSSIKKNSTYRHQIIVHVNEGNDGTLEWVRNEGIDYTYSPKNIGVCLAVNSMRRLVKTDYIYYLNDDMYVLPQWDKILWDEICNRPDNLFYLSGTMIQPHWKLDVCIQADYGTSPDTFQEEKLLQEYNKYEKQDWTGATWPPSLVHRDVWDLVGGYSIELTPGMYSDPDFTAKLWLAGVRYLKGLGNSRVYHFETKSTSRVKKNNGSLQFLMKWGMTNSTFRSCISQLGTTWAPEHKSVNVHRLRKNLIRSRVKAIWLLVTKGFGLSNKLWIQ